VETGRAKGACPGVICREGRGGEGGANEKREDKKGKEGKKKTKKKQKKGNKGEEKQGEYIKTPYELQREANIERNAMAMQSLGLN
jgi:hypothetical protein